jgi:hypothetical protein
VVVLQVLECKVLCKAARAGHIQVTRCRLEKGKSNVAVPGNSNVSGGPYSGRCPEAIGGSSTVATILDYYRVLTL